MGLPSPFLPLTCTAQLGLSEKDNHSQEMTPLKQQSLKAIVKEKWHLPVNLSHLAEDEQKVVKEMLYNESDVFAKDDADIG